MPEQAQAGCKQTIRIKARAMDMNDDKTGKKTRSVAAGPRRAKGESLSQAQSVGPGGVAGPQAPGRTGATVQPASDAGKKKTGHAKADEQRAASTTTNPKTKEATMDPKEEGIIAESIRRIDKNIDEIKIEIRSLNGRFFLVARVAANFRPRLYPAVILVPT